MSHARNVDDAIRRDAWTCGLCDLRRASCRRTRSSVVGRDRLTELFLQSLRNGTEIGGRGSTVTAWRRPRHASPTRPRANWRPTSEPGEGDAPTP
jgi:hypothetical protein